ncbi:MAG TPA: PQQ-binding-like beta-propeller repeat protein, partial [Candidatus Acidoferrum sp.]|nr:PQQ-binding-like beta-propeller repeat protein [Candidatus Acidoferrum sp.]
AGGYVYVGGWDNNVYCLNASNGASEWTYTTQGHVSSSPAVSAGIVYIGSWDHQIYALGNPQTTPIQSSSNSPVANMFSLGQLVFPIAIIIAVIVISGIILIVRHRKHEYLKQVNTV